MRPHPFSDHPFRKAVQDEVHARPVSFVPIPARIRRVALLLPREPDAVAQAHTRFSAWCIAQGVAAPAGNARQHGFAVAGRQVVWELHTEFVTLTWIAAADDAEAWPTGIGFEAFSSEQLIAAVRVDLIDSPSLPADILAGFSPASLCAAQIDAGRGAVATDFIPDIDGFTRFELAAGAMADLGRAIAVRRLLEVETYRPLALLGLPLARQVSPELAAAEEALARLVRGLVNATTTEDAQAALTALHRLAVGAGDLVERTSYRFAASRAYGELLRSRLANLGEQPLDGATTLERYLLNRVDPALATCLAVEKRQDALSGKIERATELLNTRISLDIQTQNRSVLATIATTARSQFHLQKTVEGLSTIAISYYLLAILGYVLGGLSELAHFDKAVLVAVAAPFVMAAVFLLVRSIRGSHKE